MASEEKARAEKEKRAAFAALDQELASAPSTTPVAVASQPAEAARSPKWRSSAPGDVQVLRRPGSGHDVTEESSHSNSKANIEMLDNALEILGKEQEFSSRSPSERPEPGRTFVTSRRTLETLSAHVEPALQCERKDDNGTKACHGPAYTRTRMLAIGARLCRQVPRNERLFMMMYFSQNDETSPRQPTPSPTNRKPKEKRFGRSSRSFGPRGGNLDSHWRAKSMASRGGSPTWQVPLMRDDRDVTETFDEKKGWKGALASDDIKAQAGRGLDSESEEGFENVNAVDKDYTRWRARSLDPRAKFGCTPTIDARLADTGADEGCLNKTGKNRGFNAANARMPWRSPQGQWSGHGQSAHGQERRRAGAFSARLRTRSSDVSLPKPSAGAYRPYTRGSELPQGDDVNSSWRRASSSSAKFVCGSANSDCGSENGDASPKRPSTLKREVLSLLNKITPENEDLILAQLVGLQICSAEDLWVISALIFDKALGDPFYSEVYVRCVQRLCLEHTRSPDGDGQEDEPTCEGQAESSTCRELEEALEFCGGFKRIVLRSCSRTFHQFFGVAELLEDDIQDAADDIADSLAEAVLTRRHRARACMRFLGHLFVFRILPESMLRWVFKRLIEPPRESEMRCPPKAWIECACELLCTVGKELASSPAGIQLLKPTIQRMRAYKDMREDVLAGEEAACVYPLRTQFMIQDTVEASQRGFRGNDYSRNSCERRRRT